jgi:hypothetical protein
MWPLQIRYQKFAEHSENNRTQSVTERRPD